MAHLTKAVSCFRVTASPPILAITAKHLHPIELGEQLRSLRREPEVLVTHLKPSDADLIGREIEAWAGRFSPRLLERGQVLEI